jgi:hypothetical protein
MHIHSVYTLLIVLIVIWKIQVGLGLRRGLGDQPDDGGSKHLRNVGQFLRDYTAQRPTSSVIFKIILIGMTMQIKVSSKLRKTERWKDKGHRLNTQLLHILVPCQNLITEEMKGSIRLPWRSEQVKRQKPCSWWRWSKLDVYSYWHISKKVRLKCRTHLFTYIY